MNEFTKDDLQIILLDMNINIHKAPPLTPSPSYLALRDKVVSMIHNYEETKDWEQKMGMCDKCGRYKR